MPEFSLIHVREDGSISTSMKCTACPLVNEPQLVTNKMEGTGTPEATFLMVGHQPGREDDGIGRAFTGKNGRLLRQYMNEADWDLNDCFFTNTLKCCLYDTKAKDTFWKKCRGHFRQELELVKPTAIVSFGGTALKWLTGFAGVRRFRRRGLPCVFDPEIVVYPMEQAISVDHYKGREFYKMRARFVKDLMWLRRKQLDGTLRQTDDIPTDYKRARTVEDVRSFLAEFPEDSLVYGDLETCTEAFEMATFPYPGNLIAAIGFSKGPGHARTIPFDIRGLTALRYWKPEERQEIFEMLRPFWLKHKFTGHNWAQFDHKWISVFWDIETLDIPFESMLMSHLMDEEPGGHGLETLALRYSKMMPWKKMFTVKDVTRCCEYLAKDVDGGSRVYAALNANASKKLKWLHENIQLPLALEARRMEQKGVMIDVEAMETLGRHLEVVMVEAEKEFRTDERVQAWELKNGPIGFDNPHHMRDLMENYFKLDCIKRTETGLYSADAEVLEYWEDDVLVLHPYLRRRRASKLHGTYYSNIKTRVEEHGPIIHYSMLIHGTVTGRPCIAKGAKIEVLRDISKHPEGIPIEDVKVGDYAHTFDDDLKLTMRKVLWSGKTGHLPIVRLHWVGQGQKHSGRLDLTDDHRVRLYDGSYRAAKDLQFGDRVLAMSRSVKVEYGFDPWNHIVERVESLNREEDVYDLRVEGTSNFIANEICVHNSFRNPNVANVPREDTAGKAGIEDPKIVKAMFAARPNRIFLQLDYKQAESRVLAILSDDKNMKQIFFDGQDIHSATAATVYQIPIDEFMARLKAKDIEIKGYRSDAKCFHPDTEVLTRSGWIALRNYDGKSEIIQAAPDGFSVEMSWVKPTNFFFEQHSSKTLVHLKNEGIDLRITPDHRMLTLTKDGRIRVVPPREMTKARYWLNAGNLVSDDLHRVSSRLLRLAVATQADGSIDGGIRFGFTKRRKVERLLSLLKDGEFSCKRRKKVTTIRIFKKHVPPILALLDGKQFPWWWLSLEEEQRDLVIDETRYWDSHQASNWKMFRFDSVSNQTIDVLQAICALSGKKTRLTTRPPQKPWHRPLNQLSIKMKNTTRGGNISSNEFVYTGDVACLSVPSSFILVRDGGVPVIAGQCLNFGIPYGKSEESIINDFVVGARSKERKDAKKKGCEPDFTSVMEQAAEERGKQFLRLHKENYPSVWTWLAQQERYIKTRGYLETKFGRRRRFHKIDKAAIRQAFNFEIQSTAAELTHIAIVRCNKIFRELEIDAYSILTTYDSIVFECTPENIWEVAEIAQDVMETLDEDYPWLTVPMRVDAEAGPSWGRLQEINISEMCYV